MRYYSQESNSPMFRLYLQKQQLIKALLEQRKEQELIERITERVLERISVRADVAEAVADVQELQKAIENLTKKGGK